MPTRVRTLREVVSKNKFTVERLQKAGVKPAIAGEAHAAVHTAERELVAQQRHELLEKLKTAEVSRDDLVDLLACGLAGKVGIEVGPDNYNMGPAWSGGEIPPVHVAASHAAELARLLVGLAAAPPFVSATLTHQVLHPPGGEPALTPVPEAAPPAAPVEPPLPAPSTSRVESSHPSYEETSMRIFGRVLDQEEIANLGGLPDGRISIFANEAREIKITSTGERAESLRTLKVDADGKPVLVTNQFDVNAGSRGAGIGADEFGRMVDQVASIGIDRIETVAARSLDANTRTVTSAPATSP
jgi:hypothetical protein